ncbi:uncharacterized protein LOC131950904 [Physella acuta]|uniref:uncharacterized protein LOC131950904 n=1 Tax=Physella acuta TaxID=109671 RepID=UPI0027DB05DD|nr:uncharacterized protein LOC131950904 [Physella acuta]
MTVDVCFALMFLIRYAFGACNEKYLIKSGEVIEVTSQNYPNHLPENSHCFYDMSTQFHSGDVIHLHVEDVTLDCNDQNTTLDVYDAFNLSPRHLGRICSGSRSVFISPKERLYLVFKSGSRSSNYRFKLKAEGVPDFRHCYKERAKVIQVYSSQQQIVSPYYPQEVAPNVHCRWLLKAPADQKITLQVFDANMKGSSDCVNFGLYIFDGKTTYDDEMLGQVCSDDDTNKSFESSSNYLLVVFSSGSHVLLSGGGVRLGFKSSPADDEPSEVDTRLLFTLIGILMVIVIFTIIMMIIRFLVLPARRKVLMRQCEENLRRSMRERSLSDPPPPYSAPYRTTTAKRSSSLTTLLASLFKTSRRPNQFLPAQTTWQTHSGLELPQVHSNGISAYGTGVIFPFISRDAILDSLTNEYQELPIMRSISQNSDTCSGHYDTLSSVYPYVDRGYANSACLDSGYVDGGYVDCLTAEDESNIDVVSVLDSEGTSIQETSSITFNTNSIKTAETTENSNSCEEKEEDNKHRHDETAPAAGSGSTVQESRVSLDLDGYVIPVSHYDVIDDESRDEQTYERVHFQTEYL